jgi:hypothetical protein
LAEPLGFDNNRAVRIAGLTEGEQAIDDHLSRLPRCINIYNRCVTEY